MYLSHVVIDRPGQPVQVSGATAVTSTPAPASGSTAEVASGELRALADRQLGPSKRILSA